MKKKKQTGHDIRGAFLDFFNQLSSALRNEPQLSDGVIPASLFV